MYINCIYLIQVKGVNYNLETFLGPLNRQKGGEPFANSIKQHTNEVN